MAMKVENKHRFALGTILTVALLAVLPFERIPSMDVRGLTVRLSTLVLIMAWVTVIPMGIMRLRHTMTVSDKTLFAFWLVSVCSTVWAVNTARALLTVGLFTFVLGGYVLISMQWRERFDYGLLSRWVVGVGFVTSLFGLYQFIADGFFHLSTSWTLLSPNYTHVALGFPRVQSVGNEPLYFSAFLFMPLFVLLERILTIRSICWRHLVAFLVIFAAFILGISRGAYLGFAIGAVYLFGAALWMHRITKRGVLSVVLVIVASVVVSLGMVQGVDYFKDKDSGSTEVSTNFVSHAVGGEETRSSSVTPRIAALRDGIKVFQGHPVLGVGLGNYGEVTEVQKTAENQHPIVNNEYLEVLAELGVIGGLAFGAFIISILGTLYRTLKKNANPSATIAIGAITVAFLVQYNFFSTTYILLAWVVFALVGVIPEARNSSVDV